MTARSDMSTPELLAAIVAIFAEVDRFAVYGPEDAIEDAMGWLHPLFQECGARTLD